MKFSRLKCLTTVAVCALCFLTTIGISPVAAQPAPAPQTPPAPTPAPNKQNPFESVPTGKAPETPAPPPARTPGQIQLETPKPAAEPGKPAGTENIIDSIKFRGSRRVPQE